MRTNQHAARGFRAEGPSLVYVVGTYPSLTTTFIDREIASLRRLGAKVQVVSVRRPSGPLSPEQEELRRDVLYLLPAPVRSVLAAHLGIALRRPRRYVGTLLYLVTRPHPSLRSRLKTLAHFAAGVYAARVVSRHPCDHIHAHFVDRAATMALVIGRLREVPYSVTAHANDIYVNPVLLTEKLSEATFVATCTAYNRSHLSRLGTRELASKVACIYHGLDFTRYRPEHGDRSGSDPSGTPVLLAVGQLKEKKGLAYLLQACRLLKDRGHCFRCEIVGEGPLRPQLEALLRQLSLEDTVTLTGALPHQEVIRRYERSHVFVLPAVVGGDGDRDGIPNVVLEAMAMELPVVSTRHSGIPEAVEDGESGLLVPPGDTIALTEALSRLLDDPDLRRRLGRRGRQRVLADFDAERNAKRLLHEFTDGARPLRADRASR